MAQCAPSRPLLWKVEQRNVGCAGMLSSSAAAICSCSTALVPGPQRCLEQAAAHERSRTAASSALYPSSTPGRRGALPRSHSTRWAHPNPENTTAQQHQGGGGAGRLEVGRLRRRTVNHLPAFPSCTKLTQLPCRYIRELVQSLLPSLPAQTTAHRHSLPGRGTSSRPRSTAP